MYFVPSERALLDVDLSRPSGQIHLADEALYRLYVVDQNETVRVLAQGAGGRLHHCYWRRPGAGYMPPAEDEPLKTRYLVPVPPPSTGDGGLKCPATMTTNAIGSDDRWGERQTRRTGDRGGPKER